MTNYLPPTSLRFRTNGGVLEYKPKPSYPTWLVAWDISTTIPLDVQDQLDAIAADVAVAQSSADAAQTQADLGVTNAAAAQAAADTANASANAALPQANLPDCAYLVPAMFRTISTGFSAPTLQASQWTHAYSLLNGNLSTAECKILLAANDYDYSIGFIKSSASGKLGIYVDTVQKDLVDMYNATTQLGQHFDNALVTGLGSGLHTIRLRVDGKNALSSAFQCLVSYIAIRRKA